MDSSKNNDYHFLLLFVMFLMCVIPMWFLTLKGGEPTIKIGASCDIDTVSLSTSKEVLDIDTTELTHINVLQEIVAADIEYPIVVFKQALLETGWFKCKDCSFRFNNLFGFRLKKHMSKDNPAGYIPFEHWKKSIVYYKIWQSKYYDKSRHGDYFEFLQKIGYAEADNYIKTLKNLKINEINN